MGRDRSLFWSLRSSRAQSTGRVVTAGMMGLGTLAFIVASAPRAPACGGTPPPLFCAKSYVFSQAIPNANLVANQAGVIPVNSVHFLSFIESINGACQFDPVSVQILVDIIDNDGGRSGEFNAGTFELVEGSQTIGYDVPIVSGPARKIKFATTATATFGDGSQLSQSTTQRICIVEPSPDDANTPVLEIQCIDASGGVGTAPAGHPTMGAYLLTNNHPTESVTCDISARSKNVAGLPTVVSGTNDHENGGFAISDTGDGDAFALGIGFGSVWPCLDVPFVPHQSDDNTESFEFTLAPGQSIPVAVATRSLHLCGDGSCNQGRVKCVGTYESEDVVTVCAGFTSLVSSDAEPSSFCDDDGHVTWASIGTHTLGPAIHMDGDASDDGDEGWGLDFVVDVNSMGMWFDGTPIESGDTGESQVTAADGQFGRVCPAFTSVSPPLPSGSTLTMQYTMCVLPNGASEHPISTQINNVYHVPGAPNGFASAAPFLEGEVHIQSQNGIPDAYMALKHQLAGYATIDGGSTVPLQMVDLSVTQLNGTDYQINSSWRAPAMRGDVFFDGFKITNDINCVARNVSDDAPCCLSDGSCVIKSRVQCVLDNGTPFPQAASCDPEDLVCPFRGACFRIDQAVRAEVICDEFTEDICENLGGQYAGDETECGKVAAPEAGACCLPDRTCSFEFVDVCLALDGEFRGDAVECQSVNCCPGDTTGDGLVNVGDLLDVINNWGGSGPEGDSNLDGIVNVQDLLDVITNWGNTC